MMKMKMKKRKKEWVNPLCKKMKYKLKEMNSKFHDIPMTE